MIRLEPFSKNDFSRLMNWIGSKRELVQFAGPIFSYLLTEDQLNDDELWTNLYMTKTIE